MTKASRITIGSLFQAGVLVWAGLAAGCAKDPPGIDVGNSVPEGGVTGGGGDATDPGPVVPRNPVADHGALQVVGAKLLDQTGAPVQLKGASSMWLNWESRPFAESKAGLEYARDHWKLSVIRAAMGVEVQGGYLANAAGKTTMQDRVTTIVQSAIDLGLYVIVDWHTGKANTQTADATAFFSALAQQFGNVPNLIYEPFNEPTGVTWAEIKPYHEAVVAAIRAVDPDNVIILGTPNFSQDVDIAAQDPVAGTNLLYTLHFYACTHKAALRAKGDSAIAKGIGLFITEFGATPADGGLVSKMDNNVCEGEANLWFNWMAANDVSGASWKLEQCTDSSCILSSTAPADGPWTDDLLTNDADGTPVPGGVQGGGHGQLVVNWMRQ
jgi:endoglucanase